MLKARVKTALVMLPIALLILFVLPEDAFAICVGLIVLVGAWEWIRLSGFVNQLLTEIYSFSMIIRISLIANTIECTVFENLYGFYLSDCIFFYKLIAHIVQIIQTN